MTSKNFMKFDIPMIEITYDFGKGGCWVERAYRYSNGGEWIAVMLLEIHTYI